MQALIHKHISFTWCTVEDKWESDILLFVSCYVLQETSAWFNRSILSNGLSLHFSKSIFICLTNKEWWHNRSYYHLLPAFKPYTRRLLACFMNLYNSIRPQINKLGLTATFNGRIEYWTCSSLWLMTSKRWNSQYAWTLSENFSIVAMTVYIYSPID